MLHLILGNNDDVTSEKEQSANGIAILSVLQNVKYFTRSKSPEPNFTPRKVRESLQI